MQPFAFTGRIRAATHADLDRVAVLLDAYRQFYAKSADLPKAHAFLADRFARADSHILLAIQGNGGAVGFAQLFPALCSVAAKPYGVLYDLYVSPEARRLGVASALLQAARDVAETQAWSRLELSTAHSNLAAQSLYESMGWQHDTVFRNYRLDLAG